MDEPRAQRTLVKSPPELWAEVSDVAALARHLGEFGEVRITRLEPETTVAWEGDRVRGTVMLEPAGWGTKVTLTAEIAQPGVAPEPDPPVVDETEPVPAPEPEPEPEPEQPPLPPAAERKAGFFARLFGRWRRVREEERGAAAVEALAVAAACAVEEAPAAEAPAGEAPSAEADSAEAAPTAEARAGEAPSAEADSAETEAPAGEAPSAEADTAEAASPEAEAPAGEAANPEAAGSEAGTVQAAGRLLDDDRAVAILTAVLDDLGSAHHRPFSR